MPDIFVASKPEPPKTTKSTKPLAAYVAKPKNIRFETQDSKEKIVLLLRRHWITNLSWLLLALVLVIAPLFIRGLKLLDFMPARFQFVTWLVWYLITFGYVFERFLSWFFNVNIITDERVVDIDFPSILYRDISSTKIDQVQDVTIRVGGFIRSLLNYGDVLIQTAGTEPEIRFEAVPRPDRVSKILDRMMLEEEKEKLEGRVR